MFLAGCVPVEQANVKIPTSLLLIDVQLSTSKPPDIFYKLTIHKKMSNSFSILKAKSASTRTNQTFSKKIIPVLKLSGKGKQKNI